MSDDRYVRDKPNVKLKGQDFELAAQTIDDEHIKETKPSAICRMFGTTDKKQADALLMHCLKVLRQEEASDEQPAGDERMFMLSIVRDLGPRDAVERMLAVQMAATHVATIRAGGWLSRSENLVQAQAHSTAYTKLTRAFAAQVEALRKHRNGGQQTVTVQHVNISDGGQAIVGNVARETNKA